MGANEVGDAGICIGIAFGAVACSCSKPVGTNAGIEGDESGVNRPPYRLFPTRESESSQLDMEALAELMARLSRDEVAPRQYEDVFGLGTGEEVGVRRGDGSGKSWSSSSSSSIGETLGVSLEERVGASSLPSGESGDSCFWPFDSCECRLLSTSSTLSPKVAEKVEPTSGEGPSNPIESKLALLFLLAALENFSRHSMPSFRHSSVTCTQFSQQERRGMVMTSVRGDVGLDTRRVWGGRVGDNDWRWTRQGERG